MTYTSPKSFEYHNFLRDVLHQSDARSYFLATEEDFLKGALPKYPYRNYFYGIGLTLEGERSIQIGTEHFRIQRGSLMIIGPSIIRQWLDDNFDCRHEAIFFTPDLFKSPINPHFLAELPIFKSGIQHVIQLDEQKYTSIKNTFEQLRIFRNQERIMAAQTLSLIEMSQHFHQANTKNSLPTSRPQALAREFDLLLQKHYLEAKDVAFYAEKLNLTPNHLSETIKSATGKPIKKHIEDILLLEAKSLLKQTDMTVKEITYWLGFEDPSYFVKFFKNAESITPNVYRNSSL
jgi:AraC family transcriptional regulator, transcriptional activator of pobA